MLRRRSTRRRGVLLPALVVSLLAVLLTGCGPEVSPSDPLSGTATDRSVVVVDGVERTFLVRAPGNIFSRNNGGPVAAIIAFHGVGSDAAEFEKYTGLSDAVDADRVMVVYPDGLPVPDGRRVWNAGDCCNAEGAQPADDIGFLAALINELSTRGADPGRIYVAGFSNGGMFAYRAACELGESIAGIAVVAGALTVDTEVRDTEVGDTEVGDANAGDANATDGDTVRTCRSATPVPLVVVHGTDDTIVPFAGGPLSAPVQAGMTRVRFASVSESVRLWRQHNRCSADARLSVTGDVNVARYTECAAGGEITTYTVTGGGHSWQSVDGVVDSSAIIVDEFAL
jgi:polyhydroxybutyrate depolymerase